MSITVKALEEELLGVVQTLPTFKDKAYSVFDLDDLEDRTEGQTSNLPLVGVSFVGASPDGHQVVPKSSGAQGALFGTWTFVVIVVVQYRVAGKTDTKHDGTALLDELRSAVNGFKQVNTRAWRWKGERPEPEASGDGLIFYSQFWETSAPALGANINS